jgi:hypothetical protein
MDVRPLLVVIFLFANPAVAIEMQNDVPEKLQGKWSRLGEACDNSAQPIVFSATSIVYPDGRYSDVHFTAKDSVIRILEGEAIYFYSESENLLLFHPEGIKGSAFPMARCPDPIGNVERRCGWLANLTPGAWRLIDRDKSWILAEPGDDNEGVTNLVDRIPAFDASQFVSTGEYTGYGCACLKTITDRSSERITAITSSQRLPLSTCSADNLLPDAPNR